MQINPWILQLGPKCVLSTYRYRKFGQVIQIFLLGLVLNISLFDSGDVGNSLLHHGGRHHEHIMTSPNVTLHQSNGCFLSDNDVIQQWHGVMIISVIYFFYCVWVFTPSYPFRIKCVSHSFSTFFNFKYHSIMLPSLCLYNDLSHLNIMNF